MNNEKRGEFLKNLRKSKNLTQQQLGELINYSDKNISKWENGYSFPTDPEVLTNLSNIFEVSIEEILYGDYESKENKEKIKENILDIYIKNYNERKFWKKSFVFFLFVFLITVIALLLTTYFVFIKGEIRSYKITGETKDLNIIEGSLLVSNKINILDFNKIVSNQEIDYIYFYTNIDEKEQIIFSGENDNYYIEEHKGSLEYNLKNILLSDLFIKIIYLDGKTEIIKLNVEEKFVNDEIFVENVSKEDEKIVNSQNNTNILEQQGFKQEKDFYIKRINKIEIIYYMNKFVITINDKSRIEKITKNIYSSNIIHEVIENDGIDTKQVIEIESLDCNKNKCKTEQDYYKYLNFLSELVK